MANFALFMSSENTDHSYYNGPASLAPVPMSVASALIRPMDKGKLRTNALETVEKQANQQIDMLKKQAELIMKQVGEIETRVRIASEIYQSDIGFEPIIGSIYHLYQKEDDSRFLSMVGPDEWGRSPKKKFNFVASVRLLADRTWDVLKMEENKFDEV